MSDYLSTLAARSLDLAPVVQPRLTSWFEPPRATAASSALDAIVPPTIAPRPAAEPAAREIVEPREQRSAIEEPRAFDGRRTRLIPESTVPAMDTRPHGRESGITTPAAATVRSAGREPAPIDDTPRRAAIVEAGAARVFDAVDGRTPPPTLVVAAPPEQRDRLHDRIAAIEQRLGAPGTSTRDDSLPVTPAGPRPPIHERTIGAAPSRPADSFAMEPALSDRRGPSVRVTIGRLEVRAVLPSSAPPQKTARRTPRPAAGPSLDEYLKRRGGGA